MCSLAKWLGCHFPVSLYQIPYFPRAWEDANKRLGSCSGLWLMHKQVGEYNIPFQSSKPLGSWEPGSEALCSSTRAPRHAGAQQHNSWGLASAPWAASAALWKRRWENQHELLERVVPVSSSCGPVQALTPCPLALITLKEGPPSSFLALNMLKEGALWSSWWMLSCHLFSYLFAHDKEWWWDRAAPQVGSLQTSRVGVKSCEELCFRFPSVPSDLENSE